MQTGSRGAASATAQLVSAAKVGESSACGRASCELATSLRDFTTGLRATAALHDQLPHRERYLLVSVTGTFHRSTEFSLISLFFYPVLLSSKPELDRERKYMRL